MGNIDKRGICLLCFGTSAMESVKQCFGPLEIFLILIWSSDL